MSRLSISQSAVKKLVRSHNDLSTASDLFLKSGMDETSIAVRERYLSVYQICNELSIVLPECKYPQLCNFKEPLDKENILVRGYLYSSVEVYDTSFIPTEFEFNPSPTYSYLLRNKINGRFSLVTEFSGKYIHTYVTEIMFHSLERNTDLTTYVVDDTSDLPF